MCPSMSLRKVVTCALLVAWVLLGPIGMAFDACAAMMALCDGGSCGVVAAVTVAPVMLTPPQTVATDPVRLRDVLPVVLLRALEPPPKSLRLSA